MSKNAYDSDSSGDDESVYEETNVLLGYASTEPVDDPISHFGGIPTWISEDESPSATLVKCKVCNDLMVLLLQLHSDIPEKFPGHERRLYVFTCKRKACRRKIGSVRGIRATRVAKGTAVRNAKPAKVEGTQESAVAAPRSNLGDEIFGVTTSRTASQAGNPFSTTNSSSGPINPFSSSSTSSLAAKSPQPPTPDPSSLNTSFADVLRISTPESTSNSTSEPKSNIASTYEPWPPQSSFLDPYPQFYLDADYETLSPESSPTLPPNISASMDIDTTESAAGGAADDADLFESSVDKTFQAFARRMEQNPEQVLRYEFGGSPVLYRKNDAIGQVFSSSLSIGGKAQVIGPEAPARVPKCENCQSARLFECQLTPHAITVLEENEEGLEGMDWGSIIMVVCSKDCVPQGIDEGKTGFVEEWIGVQWEELLEKR
ncbi:hypothetical protein P152DRAFT_485443 [Eremomyces bilateralis CBS 781.70]|uniref:Programmed cell death protein 2 C-terminal domain-containing protein n=1 Tax=Eremomyces bilateralis CBS 781.70 TaxID=1392243 RepID=A0A6G1FRP1_9PEZI|nr:uncharacterized protein P152DRAFT_485443 [Eremomyces bilateralis CBS 781.70]KAF1808515.1 hypothetical protein P152DRAFT_485443 [Eremomyces bilateralis CBS 781.70]